LYGSGLGHEQLARAAVGLVSSRSRAEDEAVHEEEVEMRVLLTAKLWGEMRKHDCMHFMSCSSLFWVHSTSPVTESYCSTEA